MEQMQIKNGPFAGTVIPEHEVSWHDGENTPLPFWATHARTLVFLDKYSPADGWQVIVEASSGAFDLPDTRHKNELVSDQILIQPTQLFTARLIKDGITYAQASYLCIIDGPSSWERGETTVRGRLYESSGLSGYLTYMGLTPPHGSTRETPSVSPSSQVTVIPVNVVNSDSKKEQATGSKQAEAPQQHTEPSNDQQQSDPAPAVAETAVETTVESAGEMTETQPIEAPSTAVVLQHPGSSRGYKGGNISQDVNENLRDQIMFLADNQNVTIPKITNNAEAKAFYKQLLKSSNPGVSA